MRGRAVLGVIGLVAVAIGIVARRARDEEIAATGVEVDSELLRRCADEDGALPHVARVVLERDRASPAALRKTCTGCKRVGTSSIALVGGHSVIDFAVVRYELVREHLGKKMELTQIARRDDEPEQQDRRHHHRLR